VWEFGTSVGMRELAAIHGYLFTHAGNTWKSNQQTALTLSAAGVKDGDLVEFMGDFEPVAGDVARADTGTDTGADGAAEAGEPSKDDVGKATEGGVDTSADTDKGLAKPRTPVKMDAKVSPEASEDTTGPPASKEAAAPAQPPPVPKAQIKVTLIDHKKRSRECSGRAILETSVWDFGVSVGMDHLATLHGYVFSYAGQTWESNQYPTLTLAEAGVKDGEMVTYSGNFEPVVYLHVTLTDKDGNRQRFGKASPLTSVWLFGELLGLRTMEQQVPPGRGFTFRKDGGPTWRSRQYPNLMLAATAVKSGDHVEFAVEPPEKAEED
ncbi:unnamed protein product, partial [Symbiodinium pilosum]